MIRRAQLGIASFADSYEGASPHRRGNPMKSALSGLLLAAFLQTPFAQRVTGDVSFDQATKLYTYTYQVDFRGFPETGTLIFGLYYHRYLQQTPVAHIEPEGWNMTLAYGGWFSANLHGQSLQWMPNDLQAPRHPTEPSTFSFTTPRGPGTDQVPNFYVYTGLVPNNYPNIVGHVVGPDLFWTPPLPPIPVPEPSSALFLLLGVGALAARAAKGGAVWERA